MKLSRIIWHKQGVMLQPYQVICHAVTSWDRFYFCYLFYLCYHLTLDIFYSYYLRSEDISRSLLSPTVSDRKLAFPSGSERFCSETLISARNAASVKSEPIFEIARNFSEHIPINSEQLVGITRIWSEPIPSKFLANSDHIRAFWSERFRTRNNDYNPLMNYFIIIIIYM